MFGGQTIPLIQEHFLPLGFWLERNWPTFQHRKQAPDTILLINPTPMDHQVLFPVPIGFFEDMQQQQFWDVGVRAFGQQFLHYRSVREGCRVDLSVEYDQQKQSFRAKERSKNRVTEALPFEAQSEGLRERLSILERMIQLTPDQKMARNFGQVGLFSYQFAIVFYEYSGAVLGAA